MQADYYLQNNNVFMKLLRLYYTSLLHYDTKCATHAKSFYCPHLQYGDTFNNNS